MCLADCVLLLYVPVLCTQIPVLWVVADGVAADAVAVSTCAVHADAGSACVVDMCCRCLYYILSSCWCCVCKLF